MEKITEEEVIKLLADDDVLLDEFYDSIVDRGFGNWEYVTKKIDVIAYIHKKIDQDVSVSHILRVVEQNRLCTDLYLTSLRNPRFIPTPILTKLELYKAITRDYGI